MNLPRSSNKRLGYETVGLAEAIRTTKKYEIETRLKIMVSLLREYYIEKA